MSLRMAEASLKAAVDRPGGLAPVERWVVFVAVLGTSMAFVDATAINVALPVVQQDFHAAATDLLWIVQAYNLTLAALLLLGGALGDRYGRRFVFGGGIVLFCVSSAVCGFATSSGMLVAARAWQGAGAALMIPGSLALIRTLVRAENLGRAIGIWTAGTAVATALGPALGGTLAGLGLWRQVFFLNLPLGGLALWLLGRLVPGDRLPRSNLPLDVPGALLATIALGALSFAAIEGGAAYKLSPSVITALVVGAAAAAMFLRVEVRSPNPLLPLTLFRSRPFNAACALTLTLYSSFYALLLLFPLNLVGVQGYDELTAGLAQLPLLAAVILASPLSGVLADRLGPRWPLGAGFVLAGAGLLLLAAPGKTSGAAAFWTCYLPQLILLGGGLGLSIPPLSTTVVRSGHADHAAALSAINSMLSRLANVLGVALLGSIALAVSHACMQMDAAQHSAVANQGTVNLLPALRSGGGSAAGATENTDANLPGGIGQKAFVAGFRVVMIVCGLGVWIAALMGIRRIGAPTESLGAVSFNA